MASIPIDGFKFQKAICEAVGVDVDLTRRVILDLNAEKPIIVYVEMCGSDKMLGVDLSDLGKAKVVILDKDAG